uniref:Uncharacterized protein n=1 Tax=Eutreptiella gymnastica TaxID=73025 RepID=A0A7S4GH83_9EUGL|mmetsp:Transcript_42581/g.69092  ORF Transcript_42581/g.69092 Transcript_42581/m.69092 type:complete len:282 (+) Transcript_42581:41-886(+)
MHCFSRGRHRQPNDAALVLLFGANVAAVADAVQTQAPTTNCITEDAFDALVASDGIPRGTATVVAVRQTGPNAVHRLQTAGAHTPAPLLVFAYPTWHDLLRKPSVEALGTLYTFLEGTAERCPDSLYALDRTGLDTFLERLSLSRAELEALRIVAIDALGFEDPDRRQVHLRPWAPFSIVVPASDPSKAGQMILRLLRQRGQAQSRAHCDSVLDLLRDMLLCDPCSPMEPTKMTAGAGGHDRSLPLVHAMTPDAAPEASSTLTIAPEAPPEASVTAPIAAL